MDHPRWMLYGATGFTGALIAEEAVRRGHSPLLAGRSAAKLAPLAERLGLEWAAFDLSDEAAIARRLAGVGLVFHAAGPFMITAAPMLRACLISRTHYLDITGEIPVFEYTFAHDAAARRAGIAAISGAGFDVIPSDCLAAHVAARVPGAVTLEIGVNAIGRASAGTLRSMLEIMAGGGLVRRDGELRPYPLAGGMRTLRFTHRERCAAVVPWGDLSTAYRTTGIPNITTYLAYPPRLLRAIRVLGPLGQLVMQIAPLRRLAQAAAGLLAHGPDETLMARARSHVWARAAAPDGRAAQAWLDTVEAYRFTALAGVRAVERVLSAAPTGALSPAQALGADFPLEIEGTACHDALPGEAQADAPE